MRVKSPAIDEISHITLSESTTYQVTLEVLALDRCCTTSKAEMGLVVEFKVAPPLFKEGKELRELLTVIEGRLELLTMREWFKKIGSFP